MIRPAELRKDWPWVRPLIEHVRDKTGQPWFAEDVYAAVSYQKAAMYVCDEPEGVMVVYPAREDWTNEPTLHVWLVHCVDGMERMQDEAYALLEQLRTQMGATKIVMDGRPGWQKKGWQVKKIIYER